MREGNEVVVSDRSKKYLRLATLPFDVLTEFAFGKPLGVSCLLCGASAVKPPYAYRRDPHPGRNPRRPQARQLLQIFFEALFYGPPDDVGYGARSYGISLRLAKRGQTR
jgi:hypothetical protein